jgi:hypothetical protein
MLARTELLREPQLGKILPIPYSDLHFKYTFFVTKFEMAM